MQGGIGKKPQSKAKCEMNLAGLLAIENQPQAGDLA